MKLTLRHPLPLRMINQPFGNPAPVYTSLGLNGHNGIDFYAIDGTPIYAAHDGTVIFAGEDGSGGQTIVIRTNEEFDFKDHVAFFKTIYGHQKKGTFLVKAGEKVAAGQRISSADNTGLSTGSHLHFGLKPVYQGEQDWQFENAEQNNGFKGAIDPAPYFDGTFHNGTTSPFNNDLAFGDSSNEVADLQAALSAQRLYNYEITGNFGPVTRAALFEFQKKFLELSWYERNILKGSKFGPKSRAKMNVIYGRQ